MSDGKSQWCAMFARKIRRRLNAIKRTQWYDYLLFTVDPEFAESRSNIFLQKYGVMEEESQKGLADFLSLFTHLDLPEGTALTVKGEFLGKGGYVALMIELPDGNIISPSEIKHDPASVESKWEKEMLMWASGQFYLFWHAGYHECVVLTGPALQVEKDIAKVSYSGFFLDAVSGKDESIPVECRRLYRSLDFSPRVVNQNGVEEIEFYIFSPFWGISKFIACKERCHSDDDDDDPHCIIPYTCGVCF